MKLFGHGSGEIPPLFHGLFDDAALFPPASTPMTQAVARHGDHKHAWYSAAVGWFVTPSSRLAELDTAAQHKRFSDTNIALTVPGGPGDVASARHAAGEYGWLHVKALEVPLLDGDLASATASLAAHNGHGTQVFVEIPPDRLTMDSASALKAAGLGLKLRTGGTVPEAFPSAQVLASALAAACHSGVRFKVTAGLHRALPHHDPVTGLDHHGFASLLCAVDVLQTGGSSDDALLWLSSTDGAEVTRRLSGLSSARTAAIRAQLASIGTCSITEPVDDLVSLGLLRHG